MSVQETVAYLITAIHGGESVQNIVAITKGRDYSMSAAEREAELMAAIEPLAKEKFGPDVNPKVSWVKAQEAKLDLSALSH